MAFEWWTITATANVVMVVVYAWIAAIMIQGIRDGSQWRSNPLAVATAAIFVSCTIGHGLHLLHVLPPFSILDPAAAAAAQATFADWRLLAWDVATAITAIAYWLLRSRLAIVYEGTSLCEDMEERQRQAALLHDRVVEGLDRAKAQLAAGDREGSLRTMTMTLEEGKHVITTLLGPRERRSGLGPGDLRRQAPS